MAPPGNELASLAAATLLVRPEPERVLELECGPGAEGALFLAREFPRARVRASDRDERSVHAATARVGLDPEGRIAFKAGDPGALPYPDGHFDLIVQLRGRLDLREAVRVLRPGGWALLAPGVRAAGLLGRARPLAALAARAGLEPVDGDPCAGDFHVMRLRDGD
jgi:SAM-dependent methyltransferase